MDFGPYDAALGGETLEKVAEVFHITRDIVGGQDRFDFGRLEPWQNDEIRIIGFQHFEPLADAGGETLDGIGLCRINIDFHVESFTKPARCDLGFVLVACEGSALQGGLLKGFGWSFGWSFAWPGFWREFWGLESEKLECFSLGFGEPFCMGWGVWFEKGFSLDYGDSWNHRETAPLAIVR